MYSRRPLDNMGLNCAGPLACGFFSIVSTTVLRGPQLAELVEAEPRVPRADCKLYTDF